MRLLALLLCSTLLSIQTASAENNDPTEIRTGNGFLRVCSDLEKMDAGQITDQALANIGICTGYMMGLEDGIHLMIAERNASQKVTAKMPFCMTDSDITLGQEVRIVLKYIRANPEKAHMLTALLATLALEKAFPCSTH